MLLECLPGLWQVASAVRQQLPPGLPPPAAARLQQTIASADGIVGRLVVRFCQETKALAGALAGVGPLRAALLAAAEVGAGAPRVQGFSLL